jgi:hypothetical protein
MIELVDWLIGCCDRPSFYWTVSIILRTAMALMYSFRITWHSSEPEAWQLYHIWTRPVRRDIPSLAVTSRSCMPASWAGELMPNHSFQSWGIRTTRRVAKWTRRSSFGVCYRNCPLPGPAEWVVLPSFQWCDDGQSRSVTPRGMEWSLTNGTECDPYVGSSFQSSIITRVIEMWFAVFICGTQAADDSVSWEQPSIQKRLYNFESFYCSGIKRKRLFTLMFGVSAVSYEFVSIIF